MAELTSCNRDLMACKAPIIYYLVLYRKHVLTSAFYYASFYINVTIYRSIMGIQVTC